MTIGKLRILAETTVNDYPEESLQRFIEDGVKEADELKDKLEFISNWLCKNAQYKDFKEIVDWGKTTDELLSKLK
jgi:hypothetical protein